MGQLNGDTEIANMALNLLGSASRLSSINDGGNIAAAARNSLAFQVDALIEAHPWNFAVTRTELTATSADAAENSEYEWAYQLPPDCLRWLPWRNDDAHCFAAEQEGDLLLSNDEGPVTVRYIRRVTDRSKWSPLFVRALAAQVAWDLSEIVSASQSVRDRVEKAHDKAMAEAKRSDALATGRNDRPPARFLSNAVAAMGYGGRRDPARWHR